ncbi:MAG: polysaccharide deacetylase family protein [Prevotella sp.]|nr:polysaccharide deacetylase family protein [Prevotella sp.]
MPNKKVVITNSIICSVLLVLGLLVSTLNVTQTYLTVNAPLSNGKRDSNQVAIMFIVDDAQLANNLPPMLDSLSAAEATATFFFTGSAAINNLELLQNLATSHELGNYGFSNTALNIADKNLIIEEIRLSDALVHSLTNTQMSVFTPPAALFNKHTLAMASNLGYTTVLPTDRNAVIDWDTADSNLVLSYATYNVQAGDIIALKPTTATMQCFAQIAADYLTRGLKITSLGRLLALTA